MMIKGYIEPIVFSYGISELLSLQVENRIEVGIYRMREKFNRN